MTLFRALSRAKQLRRYGLGTLLALISIFGIVFGVLVERWRDHRRGMAQLVDVADSIKTETVRSSLIDSGWLKTVEDIVRGPANEVVEIELRGLGVTDASLSSFPRSPILRQVRIGNSALTSAGLASIRLSRALKFVALENNRAIERLPEGWLSACRHLEDCYVTGTAFQADDLNDLALSPVLNSVTINDARFDDSALDALAHHPTLTSIVIYGERLTAESTQKFKSQPRLKKVELWLLDPDQAAFDRLERYQASDARLSVVVSSDKVRPSGTNPFEWKSGVRRLDGKPRRSEPPDSRAQESANRAGEIYFGRPGDRIAGLTNSGLLVCYGRTRRVDSTITPIVSLCDVAAQTITRVPFDRSGVSAMRVNDAGTLAIVHAARPMGRCGGVFFITGLESFGFGDNATSDSFFQAREVAYWSDATLYDFPNFAPRKQVTLNSIDRFDDQRLMFNCDCITNALIALRFDGFDLIHPKDGGIGRSGRDKYVEPDIFSWKCNGSDGEYSIAAGIETDRNQIVSIASNGAVCAWNLQTGRFLSAWRLATYLTGAVISTDARYAAVVISDHRRGNHTLRLLDLSDHQYFRLAWSLKCDTLPIQLDRLLAFQDASGMLRVVSIPEMREIVAHQVQGIVREIAVSEKLEMVAWTQDDDSARVLRLPREKLPAALAGDGR